MIWCVEDDASIRDIELYALNSQGLEARGFEDGLSVMEALKQEQPDLLVLDIMLPGLSGLDILKKIKASSSLNHLPVIMATAKGAEYDKVMGLDLGADYYLAKPFGVMEFVACVKAVLRRTKKEIVKTIEFHGLEMHLESHVVLIDHKPIELTYKEYALLQLFLTHPNQVFTRDQLFNEVWGMDYYGETRTVDNHIRTLRQKLKDYGQMIKTVRNVGYRLEDTSWERKY